MKLMEENNMYIFGPVPSRRLGMSLGINIVPPKHCSYSCVYCQLGRTKNMQIDLVDIADKENIIKELDNKIRDFTLHERGSS